MGLFLENANVVRNEAKKISNKQRFGLHTSFCSDVYTAKQQNAEVQLG